MRCDFVGKQPVPAHEGTTLTSSNEVIAQSLSTEHSFGRLGPARARQIGARETNCRKRDAESGNDLGSVCHGPSSRHARLHCSARLLIGGRADEMSRDTPVASRPIKVQRDQPPQDTIRGALMPLRQLSKADEDDGFRKV